jgi:hypothetical protein
MSYNNNTMSSKKSDITRPTNPSSQMSFASLSQPNSNTTTTTSSTGTSKKRIPDDALAMADSTSDSSPLEHKTRRMLGPSPLRLSLTDPFKHRVTMLKIGLEEKELRRQTLEKEKSKLTAEHEAMIRRKYRFRGGFFCVSSIVLPACVCCLMLTDHWPLFCLFSFRMGSIGDTTQHV